MIKNSVLFLLFEKSPTQKTHIITQNLILTLTHKKKGSDLSITPLHVHLTN